MNKEKALLYFQTHFDYIKKSIFDIAVWSDSANYDNCKEIEEALVLLADAGDKNAAAMYCIITAYDNHANSFSPDTACRLVFEHDAVEAYQTLFKKEFFDILDEYHYDYLYGYPAIQLLKSLTSDTAKQTDE